MQHQHGRRWVSVALGPAHHGLLTCRTCQFLLHAGPGGLHPGHRPCGGRPDSRNRPGNKPQEPRLQATAAAAVGEAMGCSPASVHSRQRPRHAPLPWHPASARMQAGRFWSAGWLVCGPAAGGAGAPRGAMRPPAPDGHILRPLPGLRAADQPQPRGALLQPPLGIKTAATSPSYFSHTLLAWLQPTGRGAPHAVPLCTHAAPAARRLFSGRSAVPGGPARAPHPLHARKGSCPSSKSSSSSSSSSPKPPMRRGPRMGSIVTSGRNSSLCTGPMGDRKSSAWEGGAEGRAGRRRAVGAPPPLPGARDAAGRSRWGVIGAREGVAHGEPPPPPQQGCPASSHAGALACGVGQSSFSPPNTSARMPSCSLRAQDTGQGRRWQSVEWERRRGLCAAWLADTACRSRRPTAPKAAQKAQETAAALPARRGGRKETKPKPAC